MMKQELDLFYHIFKVHIEQHDYYLVVVDQHIRQMINSAILNGLRFRLLRVTVV